MLKQLPEHLLNRSRIHNHADLPDLRANFVLYWMRTAVRSDENPALDVARCFANDLKVPLLVYHAISEHYRFASDRHHTFMLQGARDVQQQFDEIGVSYAFHLATPDDRAPHLVDLAKDASVVVTEDMPVDPARRFLDRLVARSGQPIVCVDTACVVPMRQVAKSYGRAFQFRTAIASMFDRQVTASYPSLPDQARPFDQQLAFDAIDLQSADLAELVARCEIDHSVGPVVDTCGGGCAGYRRWLEFKSKRISSYARRRNDALQDGVSRMSAYLHYGMVSPFRLAREAAEIDDPGAEKWLEELLIWRELAYNFCFHHSDHDQWSALPDWAQSTLAQHATDARQVIYTDEQLARARTNDPFWNAAQRSLLQHGELHNNVRMTWGKAILNWRSCPKDALRVLIDLNNRYALDGRDPASYGGLLWCLGLFDRPFKPEQRIFGTVRMRTTPQHQQRLDAGKYSALISQPRFDPQPAIAIVGAGIAGLIAARTLADHGVDVIVFDKGRGVSGRMSTRTTNVADSQSGCDKQALTFDHGAQYFTARDPRFRRFVNSWIEQGIVARWPNPEIGADQRIVVIKGGQIQSESRPQSRFVGVPKMNRVGKHLAEDLSVQTSIRVAPVERMSNGVRLRDDAGAELGVFDHVVVTAPAGQAAELLDAFPDIANSISNIQMAPCYAAMVALENPVTDQWVGAFLHDSFLSWASRNGTKPRRNFGGDQLVIHAKPEWTQQHWDEDPEEIAQLMIQEFWRVTAARKSRVRHAAAHRWKFAIPVDDTDANCFVDPSGLALACGDWASGGRVEGAFLSGMAAAGRILGRLKQANGAAGAKKVLSDSDRGFLASQKLGE